MQIIEDVAHVLNVYKIGAKHGIKSIFELDEKLKTGKIREEDVMEDFMELDYLESRRDDIQIKNSIR